MRYVVGYTPKEQSRSALNLAITLARGRTVELDIVAILPKPSGSHEDREVINDAESAEMERRGRTWLEEARAMLPANAHASGRLYRAESVARGLIEAAVDPTRGAPAGMIAVGSASGGVRGHFTLGAVAATLLHAAPAPVALVPPGYKMRSGISRITTFIGTRQGAEALAEVAVDSVASRHIPLRFVSLASFDIAEFAQTEPSFQRAKEYVNELVERARAALPPECPVTSVTGEGYKVERTIKQLTFEDDEIVFIGSSRLAGPNSLFIGPAAHRLIRVLPVPMIVVPRDYRAPLRPTHVVAWTMGGEA